MLHQTLFGSAGQDCLEQSKCKMHDATELAIEVLSPGRKNERRDREIKPRLYSRHGVLEYWVVDWAKRRIEIYRRQQAVLELAATLYEGDVLVSPILPGF